MLVIVILVWLALSVVIAVPVVARDVPRPLDNIKG
jgi:hypothetical protein